MSVETLVEECDVMWTKVKADSALDASALLPLPALTLRVLRPCYMLGNQKLTKIRKTILDFNGASGDSSHCCLIRVVCRGTSFIRNRHTLGPYSRPMSRGLLWS